MIKLVVLSVKVGLPPSKKNFVEFKNDEKCLFYLQSSFRSQDI